MESDVVGLAPPSMHGPRPESKMGAQHLEWHYCTVFSLFSFTSYPCFEALGMDIEDTWHFEEAWQCLVEAARDHDMGVQSNSQKQRDKYVLQRLIMSRSSLTMALVVSRLTTRTHRSSSANRHEACHQPAHLTGSSLPFQPSICTPGFRFSSAPRAPLELQESLLIDRS
jgi:hypothetical protein